MLRAATERRYEYSKFSCLKAAREMLRRYLKLRTPDKQSFCCKVVDFGALTATITLCLGLIDPAAPYESLEMQSWKGDDRAMVQTVLELMEELSMTGKDVIAKQSVKLIKTLLDVESRSTSSTGNLRLTIPYFGTIDIARPPPRPPTPASPPKSMIPQHSFPEQPPIAQTWSQVPPYTQSSIGMPLVSFTSSQFPPLVQEPFLQDWQPSEADTLFFDSLLNTDIEGNWIF